MTDDSAPSGSSDVFVTKISLGGTIRFSTLIGGSFADVGNDIAVDSSGHSYVTGYTLDAWELLTDYPVTDGSTHSGTSDVFVTKLSVAGGIAFSTLIGGSGTDHGNGIAVDDFDNMYVTGYTDDTGRPITNYPTTNRSSHNGIRDVFITKLSPVGARTFSTFLGGSDYDYGNDIAVDGSGNM